MVGTALTGHAAAIRALAARWLHEAGKDAGDEGGDFTCSPAGLWLALTALAAGARGGTAEELRGLLGVAGPEAAAVFSDAAAELAGTDALTVATGVWSRVPVAQAYRSSLPDVGFGDLDGAGIDAWVREATGGLIDRLPVGPTARTALLLVSALALKARWEKPFDGVATRDLPFTDASGRTRPVATMSAEVPAADAWTVPDASGGRTRVVELRCRAEGAGPAVRVRFVLGEPGREPVSVLPAAWAPEAERLPVDADEVRLLLPRLSLRTRIDVTPQLARLGLAIGSGGPADLSGISGGAPLALGEVVQETVLRIAEEGVEAASATASPVFLSAGPERIERIAFDRPFGVVVLDGDGATPLFTAWQSTAPRDAWLKTYDLIDEDPDPASVRRVTFVPFLPGGRPGAVLCEDDVMRLPSGEVLPGEDWVLDTSARVPLETAGYYRQRVHPFAYEPREQRLYVWLDGDRYRGRRPHAADADLIAADADAIAGMLPYGLERQAVLDAARSFREQDDASYYADNLRLLEPAYLRATTAEGGSGFGRRPDEWRARRSMVVEALHKDGTFLDVGCANGLLMESVREWAAERGRVIEPYGVDFAPRLVELARHRLPRWAERISVGNAVDWRPADGRRFTFVHVLVDCVPGRRLGDLVRRLLAELVEPGGRLLVSVYQPEGGTAPGAAERLGALGVPVAGAASGTGPERTATTAWVDA